MAKKSYPKIVSPALVCAFAYCEKPDSRFGEDTAKYKISLLFPKDRLDQIKGMLGGKEATGREVFDVIKEAHKDSGQKENIGFLKDGDEMTTKDGEKKEQFAGMFVVEAKTKNAPTRVDSQRNALPGKVSIRGGDIVKVLMQPSSWSNGGKEGVSLYLNEVMLIEKRALDGIPAEEGGFVVNEAYYADDDDDDGGIPAQSEGAAHGDY